MSAQKKNSIPPAKLALYDALIKTNLKIQRKGAANPLHFVERPYVQLPR